MLIFALLLAAGPAAQLTETQQRDIGCVAALAVHADGMKNQWEGYDDVPGLPVNGRRWAGIVGERIMKETGLPQEIIGFAITEAARSEQGRLGGADEPRAVIYERLHACLPLMEAELAASDAANKPLPKPQRSNQ